jgi:cytosine deaminase
VEAIRLRATRLAVIRAGKIIANTPPAVAALQLPNRHKTLVDWRKA